MPLLNVAILHRFSRSATVQPEPEPLFRCPTLKRCRSPRERPSPVVAYRVWQWDSLGLKSLNNEQWFPGRALEANASHCGKGHGAPKDGCSCGIYAAKDFQHLVHIGYAGCGVHGEVYLWGRVVEHSLGHRAQFAYPKSLVLPPDAIPFRMSEAESRLETLMAYGADIRIAAQRGGVAGKESSIRLWSKQSGFDMPGFDWLVESRKQWYSYREQDRTLEAGDRVAVHGKGIGVVASADSDDVHVRMWNKLTLRMPRKQVVWNRQNSRWESNGTGAFARTIPPDWGPSTGRLLIAASDSGSWVQGIRT